MDKNDNIGFGQTNSVDSAASEYQINYGRFTTSNNNEVNQNEMIIQYGEFVFDCVAVFLICPRHNRLALNQLNSKKGFWFPCFPVRSGQGFLETLILYLKQIFVNASSEQKNVPPFKPPILINIMTLQMPQYFEFVRRMTFFTQLSVVNDTDCCINNSRELTWISMDNVSSWTSLWGPEPILYTQSHLNGTLSQSLNFYEFSIKELMTFIAENGTHQEMLRTCGCNEREIINLYSEFIQHCYPSQFMNYYSFLSFLSKYSMQLVVREQLPLLFRAFTFNFNLSHINFYEFIIGLAAMDKQMTHGGRIGEARVGYIFRYYNSSGTPNLNYNDICLLVRDIMSSKNMPITTGSLEKEVNQIYSILGVQPKNTISGKSFAKAVGSLQIRGTSGLFRSIQPSPLTYLQGKSFTREIQMMQINPKLNQSAISIRLQHIKGICLKCKEKQYTLAAHYVKILQDGSIVEPQELKGLADVLRIPKAYRRLSDLSFYSNNICNVLVDLIHLFAENPSSNNWLQKQTKPDLVDKIVKLCSEAEILFANESRVIKVSSPVYIFGDIHGNLRDLMIYERIFWHMGPSCIAYNFLFLGDYVDRGIHSVECITYLLCLKLLSPNRFTLLRGNHELRSVQHQFTFYRECLDKFDKFGSLVWETFNKVFDTMPICAIVDEQIFCAHGGIPATVNKIEQVLLEIPVPLIEPESQSVVAWEMLWNDPISNKEYDEYVNLLKINNTSLNALAGFLPNTKRGTAYYFGEEAVLTFLQVNGFSHVIRAHEVIPNGFQFHCGGKVITIFSSSKYCNGFNESAVALVDLNKIRIIKVDTN